MKLLSLMLISLLGFIGCLPKDDDLLSLPAAPNQPTISITANTDWNYTFTAQNLSAGVKVTWDFGDEFTHDTSTTKEYSLPNTYPVRLIVNSTGGTAYVDTTVTIAEFNPASPIYDEVRFLTGGVTATSTRTWVMSPDSAAIALGPSADPASYADPIDQSWFAAPAMWLDSNCMDDEYTFAVPGFAFTHNSNGQACYDYSYANTLFDQAWDDFAVQPLPHTDVSATWLVQKPDSTTTLLTLTDSDVSETQFSDFLGKKDGSNIFQILEITDSTLFVRNAYIDQFNPTGAQFRWDYKKLIPKQ